MQKIAVGMFYPIAFAGEPPQRVADAVRTAAMRVGRRFEIEEQRLQTKVSGELERLFAEQSAAEAEEDALELCIAGISVHVCSAGKEHNAEEEAAGSSCLPSSFVS